MMTGGSEEHSRPRPAARPIDTTVLRKVLRLVHCLQKERGASCAYKAAPHHRQDSLLIPARRDTDQALALLGKSLDEPTVPTTLKKIRSMIHDTQQQPLHKTPGFHKLLLCYNTLVSHIIHEYILRKTASQRVLQRQASACGGQDTAVESNNNNSQHSAESSRIFRSERSSVESSKTGMRKISSTGSGMGRSQSDHALSSTLQRAQSEQAFTSHTRNLSSANVNFVDHKLDEASTTSSPSPTSTANYFAADKVIRLVTLLDLFVRLKESAGVERATLCSMLAAGSVESRYFLLSDLVLQVENQRRQLEELGRLPPGPLHDLIQELVTMSPQMRELQDAILLNGLQLEQLKASYDSNQLWNLKTLYINKLHSCELLLVEEIECCTTGAGVNTASSDRGSTGSSGESSEGVLTRAFGDQCQDKSAKTKNLLECIESLPPEEIKKRLLSAMSKTTGTEATEEHADGVPEVVDASPKGVEELLSELVKAPASKEWEIDLYEVHFLKRIGRGAAGTTYLAKWSGLEVAVKVASINEMGLEGWRHEVQALQKLHHPNIIRLLGSVYHPKPLTFCLVLEYCNAGDLATALERPTPPNFFFLVASSISKGMTYLHSRGIIHRDIKPANVLLDGSVSSGLFSVKVTDFGVATESGATDNKTAETGTYRWMSPEVIRHEPYTQTADVYSYAVVLWQLVSREVPFSDKSQIEAAAGVGMEDLRPPFPSGTPPCVQEVIERCWDSEAKKRPLFDKITETLVDIEKMLATEEKEWMRVPLGHRVYRQNTEPTTSHIDIKALERQTGREQRKPKANPKTRGLRSIFSRKSSYF